MLASPAISTTAKVAAEKFAKLPLGVALRVDVTLTEELSAVSTFPENAVGVGVAPTVGV
jgi:hypothetical protein